MEKQQKYLHCEKIINQCEENKDTLLDNKFFLKDQILVKTKR